MPNNEIIRHINASAMRGGIVMGLFGILTLCAFKGALYTPFFSSLFSVMLLASPVLATILTLQYRRAAAGSSEPFGFLQGFLFTLFTGFYASLWISVFTFVYLQYFDQGTIFAAYARQLEEPATQAYLRQSGMEAQLNAVSGGRGAQGFVQAMESLGAATYAALNIYLTLIFGPVISTIVGLICRRGRKG